MGEGLSRPPVTYHQETGGVGSTIQAPVGKRGAGDAAAPQAQPGETGAGDSGNDHLDGDFGDGGECSRGQVGCRIRLEGLERQQAFIKAKVQDQTPYAQ